jgi:hypothetical protein
VVALLYNLFSSVTWSGCMFFYGFKTCQVVVLYMVTAALTTITKVINQPTTPEGRMDFKLNRIYVVGFLRFGLRMRSTCEAWDVLNAKSLVFRAYKLNSDRVQPISGIGRIFDK